MEVAVGQGRERGHSARMYTSMSSPPHPLSQPWSTVKKGWGVMVGWKEGWWRLAEVGLLWEMGELFEKRAPTGYHRLELSTHGKS